MKADDMDYDSVIDDIIDERNRKRNIEDVTGDSVDWDIVVKRLSVLLKVNMPRETRDAFITSCEDRNWDMSVCVFLDRLVETAKVNGIIHNREWSFGKVDYGY